MKRRRAARWIIIIVGLVAVATVVVVQRRFGLGSFIASGSSAVERWAGEQLKLIAADLMRPKLEFDGLDYTFPGTLTLRDVRLVDGDVVVLEATTLVVVLRDRPARGKPIVIDAIELTSPVVRLVVRDDDSLAGFTDFAKAGGGRKRDDGGSTRPSDVLAIRKMTVTNGAFRWTALDGTTMELDDLAFNLDGKPAEDPGWYAFDTRLDRPPVLKIRTSGRFQIDEGVLDVAKLALDVSLDEETRHSLPPSVQRILERNDVRGNLAITGTANLPLTRSRDTRLDLAVTLTDAYYARDEVQVPVDRLTMDVSLAESHLSADPIDAGVFGGRLQGSAGLRIDGDLPMEVTLRGEGLLLQRALRETASIDTKLTGTVTLDGTASASLHTLPADLAGSGRISIENGRLMGDPLFGGLMGLVGRKKDGGTDSGAADFSLRPDRVEFTKVKLVGGSTAARGEGEMLFDDRINFRFNAGPLERAQDLLGVIGDITSLVTDRIVTYQVSGTWADPRFDVRPLGLGANAEQ